jgi:hypothetical protein
MAKSDKQINKESGNTVQETTLAVVDYRMGQLETAVKDGFAAHDKKLDGLTSNFATKEELAVVNKRLNDYQWYFRALVTAVLFALGVAINGLLSK